METMDHRQPLGSPRPSRVSAQGKRVYRWDWSAEAWTDTGAWRPPAVARRAAAVGHSVPAQPVLSPTHPEPRAAPDTPPSNPGPAAPRLEDPPPRGRRRDVLAVLLFGALCLLILALLSLAGGA